MPDDRVEEYKDPVMLAVEELDKDALVTFVQKLVHTLYWDMDVDDDGKDYEEWHLDKEWDSDILPAIAETLPAEVTDALKKAMEK